jgi:hypothetical protein
MGEDIPDSVIATILMRARSGVSTGRDQHPAERAYYRRCTHFHWRSGTIIMFTRDTGHHRSGWMKNPDFERCLHVSFSFREPRPEVAGDLIADPARIAALGGVIGLAPFDRPVALTWAKAILGDALRLSWEEGPFSAHGKAVGVRHWRVFCDPSWAPLKPRGEVYNRDLTEKGWRSWSEINAEPNWVSAE